MTRNLPQRIVLAAFAALLVLAPLGHTVASNTPSSFHWARKASQFTVQAGDNYSDIWNKLVPQAISNWNKGDAVTIKTVSGGTSAQNCSPTKGRIEVCSFLYGTQEGWLGLTRLFFDNSGDHVESVTVQMNDSFLQRGSQYNNDEARRHTICHEMGHAIGLDHVNTKSCMNDSQNAVFNNLSPINKDYRELDRIYQHKDSYTTLAGKQKSGKDKKSKKDKKGKHKNSKKKQDRTEARKALRDRKKKDRASSESFFDPTSLPAAPSGLDSDETVTVQRLDDGQKVVTFITWARE